MKMPDMTPRQRAALASPCGTARETLDARFWQRVKGMSTILTVNR